jgi:predicted phage-related endonuclease
MNAPANLSDAAFRASVVGASEVAALFDVSPWLTRFELWHRKNGTIATPEFNARNVDGSPVNSRIHWGVKLENLIIQEACERWGYEPIETPSRVDNGAGLGGHPDRVVWCPDRKAKVVLEAKSVDWLQRKKWGDEPPTQYLLQPNTYAGLLKAEHFDVVTMVLGGNTDIERSQNLFRPKLYAETERRVAEFWESVRAGKPPKPDYTRDGAVIQEVIGEPNDTLIDLTRNNRAGLLAADYLVAKARMKAAETEMEAAKAELLEAIGDNSVAQLEGYRIACGMTKGSSDKLITAEMVGEVIKGRRGYRRFDLKEVE